MKAEITMMLGGRFISRHPQGVTVYHDSRHRVIKSRVEGGTMELVLERQDDGSFREQLLSFVNADGERTLIEEKL